MQNIDTTTYEELKEEIRTTLMAPMDESFQKLHLIDTIKRLGVSYHFQKEIEDALQDIYDHDYKDDEECLKATSLRFRLLRENGFSFQCGESKSSLQFCSLLCQILARAQHFTF